MASLRDRILALFSEKKQEPRKESHDVILSQKPVPEPRIEPVPVATSVAMPVASVDSQPAVTPAVVPGDGRCPKCASSLWREICCGWRCQQCGHQQGDGQAVGVSRRDFELGLWRGRKAVVNGPGFQQARVRLLGR